MRPVDRAAVVRRSRIGAADRLALGLLVAIPVVMGVPPSIFGRPLLAGDNLTQNYPLRVLAGTLLRQGHLPLWDAWMWSGTPLLAGWNAGAMYPGTWLFAVMGGVSAWTVNYVAVGVVVATGMYVFLRQLKIGPLAAFLGAAVFSFAGFMAAQMLHIGLVAGLSFLPWMLVALNGMAGRERGPGTGWVLLLGVAGGLVLLAGDPRAITNAGEIVAAYAVALAWRDRRRALQLLAGVALGVVLAFGLGAVQWIPGVQFIASSQRGQTSYAFYGNLSLTPGNLPLVLFPYLLGGYGDLATHGYSGPYNLPELTWALGILPLVATFALASRRLRSPAGRPLGVWYVIIAVGLLTALGSSTPLGHVFARIPVFGAERLQARNIMLADFGMAVLFAVWVDEVLAPDRLPSEGVAPEPSALGRAARLRGLVPVAAGLLIVAAGEIFEARTASALGVAASRSSGVIRTMTPYLAPATVIVALAGLLVLGMHRLERRRRRQLLTLLAVADLAFFVVNESIVPINPSYIAPQNQLSAEVAALAGPQGRYAIYNPIQVNSDPGNVSVYQLGLSDLSIVHRVLEVGGYGSAVDASYQEQTASHWVETLRTSSLRSEVFDDLDLRVLLTLPVYIANPLAPGSGPPTPLPGPPQTGEPSDTPGSPGLAPNVGQLTIPAGGRVTYQLPGPLDVRSVTVTLDNGGGNVGAGTGGGAAGGADPPHGVGGVRVGLVAGAGPTTWVGTTPDPAGTSTFAAGRAGHESLEVVLAGPRGASAVAETVVVTTTSGERLLLDGALEGSLQPPHWRYGGTVGPWLVYLDTATRGLSWVVPLGSTEPGVASVPGSSATTAVQWPQGPNTTTVSTPVPGLVVRSVAYTAGWHAELVGAGGRTTVPVERLGPVQAVRVPAGTTTIVWSYTSATAVDAAWVSAGTALLFLCAGLAAIFARRRSARERDPVPARNRFASIS